MRRLKKPNPAATSFRIEADLMARIKERAKAEDRSVTAIVRRALTNYLEHANEQS